jgi:hypothetical protein
VHRLVADNGRVKLKLHGERELAVSTLYASNGLGLLRQMGRFHVAPFRRTGGLPRFDSGSLLHVFGSASGWLAADGSSPSRGRAVDKGGWGADKLRVTVQVSGLKAQGLALLGLLLFRILIPIF